MRCLSRPPPNSKKERHWVVQQWMTSIATWKRALLKRSISVWLQSATKRQNANYWRNSSVIRRTFKLWKDRRLYRDNIKNRHLCRNFILQLRKNVNFNRLAIERFRRTLILTHSVAKWKAAHIYSSRFEHLLQDSLYIRSRRVKTACFSNWKKQKLLYSGREKLIQSSLRVCNFRIVLKHMMAWKAELENCRFVATLDSRRFTKVLMSCVRKWKYLKERQIILGKALISSRFNMYISAARFRTWRHRASFIRQTVSSFKKLEVIVRHLRLKEYLRVWRNGYHAS